MVFTEAGSTNCILSFIIPQCNKFCIFIQTPKLLGSIELYLRNEFQIFNACILKKFNWLEFIQGIHRYSAYKTIGISLKIL